MRKRFEIWIISHPWPVTKDNQRGYEWELYNRDKPVCKSSPSHGESYFFQKKSAIKAAIRFRKLMFPCRYFGEDLKRVCPITDVTNRGHKPQKVRIH